MPECQSSFPSESFILWHSSFSYFLAVLHLHSIIIWQPVTSNPSDRACQRAFVSRHYFFLWNSWLALSYYMSYLLGSNSQAQVINSLSYHRLAGILIRTSITNLKEWFCLSLACIWCLLRWNRKLVTWHFCLKFLISQVFPAYIGCQIRKVSVKRERESNSKTESVRSSTWESKL